MHFSVILCFFLHLYTFIQLGKTTSSQLNHEMLNVTWKGPKVIQIKPLSELQLDVTKIPDTTNYIICQVHTQYLNVTLSNQPAFVMGTSVTGTNIGTIQEVNSRQSRASWYLISEHNTTINALVYVTYLTWNDPLPGGCNLEFNLENDPNIHIQYNGHTTTLLFQWANIGNPRDSDCEKQALQNELEYKVYVYYLSENDFREQAYFDAITNMQNADFVHHNGKKLQSLKNDGTKSRLYIGSYVGQGAVYSVIVKKNNGNMASYIPTVTHSCDLNDRNQSCVSTDVIWKVLAVIGGIAGLFLCFVGHRYFMFELFVAGFLAVILLSVILLSKFTALSTTGLVVLSAVFGIVGGALWVMLWWAYGLHVLSVLLFGLVGGYIVSSVIFFTPFGNLIYWSKMFNYGMSFTCGVLILPVILITFTKILSILTCAFVGGYLFILSIDAFLNTGMKYIIVNSVRHAVVDGYINVIVTSPFLTIDIVLACFWALLFVSGTLFQLYRETGRPDFPECPRKKRVRRRGQQTSTRTQRYDPGDDEEQPLLREGRHTVYTYNRQPLRDGNIQQEELIHPGRVE